MISLSGTIKNSHYEELSNNYCFVPVGIETFGSWGFEGHKLVKEIGKKVMEETGEKDLLFTFFNPYPWLFREGTPPVF